MPLESNYHPLYQSRSFSLDAAGALVIEFDETASVASEDLIPEGEYQMSSDIACWVKEGPVDEEENDPEAEVATAGNMYLPANKPMLVQFNGLTKLAVIGIAEETSGVLSLVKRD